MSSVPPVDFIVKLGGSAITDKANLETLKQKELKRSAEILAACWKKDLRFVVVHGAGSFGHHQAKQHGVNQGWSRFEQQEQTAFVREGFAVTRLSVCKLNQLVVEALVSTGLPAVGLSLCESWETNDGHVVKDGCSGVKKLLSNGFAPVLHGDCVLDEKLGCKILSGDTVIQVLCRYLHPPRIVFASDVLGIFDKDPSNQDARILSEIKVDPDGNLSVPVETGSIHHDVTGGLKLKLATAVSVVVESKGATRVVVCGVNSDTFEHVCSTSEQQIRSLNGPGTIVCLNVK